jgi:hypothetical protein
MAECGRDLILQISYLFVFSDGTANSLHFDERLMSVVSGRGSLNSKISFRAIYRNIVLEVVKVLLCQYFIVLVFYIKLCLNVMW